MQLNQSLRQALNILIATFLLVLSLASLNAQLADSGTPGDRAVYTLGTGATLASGIGTSVIHGFDAVTVDDTADSFELQAGGLVGFTAPGGSWKIHRDRALRAGGVA